MQALHKKDLPAWNTDDDDALLTQVSSIKESGLAIQWLDVGKIFNVHAITAKNRYNHLSQPFVFTNKEEDKLVNLATEYFDNEKEPDWQKISEELRQKPPKNCEKQYYKVMSEFWNEDQSNMLLILTEKFKLDNGKVDWKAVGMEMNGRPPRVCQEQYAKLKEKGVQVKERSGKSWK